MFGTLKAGKKRNAGSMVFVEQNKQIRTSPGSTHNACKPCRDRKLKCTGEVTGCKRCKSSDVRCEYRSATEDKRGSKSRRTQSPTIGAARKPPLVAPSAQESSSSSNNEEPVRKIRSNGLDINNHDLDIEFSVPSFSDSGVAAGFYDDLAGIDTTTVLNNIKNKTIDVQDSDILQKPFEADMLADLDLPPLDVVHYGAFSSNSGNGSNADTPTVENVIFMDTFSAPQIQWHSGDGSSSHDSVSGSDKHISSSRPRMSKPSTTLSKPASSYCCSEPPFTATLLESQHQPIWNPLDSPSGSDSDSSGKQCRCSNRALRLLEKLPNASQSSSWSPLSGSSGDPSSSEKPSFIQAATLFLSRFSHYLGVFSTISQCRSCLRKSSFSMILLILAQRLTSRIGLLLQEYVHTPTRSSNSQKFMLTIAESAVEYDNPLSLVSALIAGKVCRLAACIAKIKSVCLVAGWTSYGKGFEALEAPLRERMGELEAMM
ncbi:hypothetical protein F4679DRAFT_542893 [Xylaria curta]|nr:hypothetical protein F4679DRAFT_542893 [Xylaria curta]